MARRRIDFDALRRELGDRCFICELLAGNPEFRHHVVYEDERTVAFLQRFQTLYGYVIVAPKEHREEVTGDFSRDEYLALQEAIHRVGEARSADRPRRRSPHPGTDGRLLHRWRRGGLVRVARRRSDVEPDRRWDRTTRLVDA